MSYTVPVFVPGKPSPLREVIASICKSQGYVRNRDVQAASGATERCIHNLLDRMVAEGSLWKRQAVRGAKIVYFDSQAAADAYVPPPKAAPKPLFRPSRAKPPELRKKAGRPAGAKDSKPRVPKAAPKPKGLRPLTEQTHGNGWRNLPAIGLDKPAKVLPRPERDFRHQVLPGEAPRVIDAAQCRPWAQATAAQIGSEARG